MTEVTPITATVTISSIMLNPFCLYALTRVVSGF